MIFNKIWIDVSLDRSIAGLIYCPDASWTKAQWSSQADKSQRFEMVSQHHCTQPMLWVSCGVHRENKMHPALLLDPVSPSHKSCPYAQEQAAVMKGTQVLGIKGKIKARRETHLLLIATAAPSLPLSGRKAAHPSPHPSLLHKSLVLIPTRSWASSFLSLWLWTIPLGCFPGRYTTQTRDLPCFSS